MATYQLPSSLSSSFEVNRWIVSGHEFIEHKSVSQAGQERERLHLLFPKKHFRIYRIASVSIPEGVIVAFPAEAGADHKCSACGALQH